MGRIMLELPVGTHRDLWDHLYSDIKAEQAAFAFARAEEGDDGYIFHAVEWLPVSTDGFAARTGFYFELTDEMRASVIKRAFDLNACLMEFHSHIGPWPAAFSASDWSGFEEFVPHVWWRLKGQPYVAVVVARSTFDGLVWITGPTSPQRVGGLRVDGRLFQPTGLSTLAPAGYDD